jgi:hypothetical protein
LCPKKGSQKENEEEYINSGGGASHGKLGKEIYDNPKVQLKPTP